MSIEKQAIDTVPLLQVKNLSIAFSSQGNRQRVVDTLNFSIQKGQTVALVGESGSGKSVTAMSLLQLHDSKKVCYESGHILFQGKDLLTLKEQAIRAIRGKEIAMIFQEPMTSLNPTLSIATQIAEVLQIHEKIPHNKITQRVIELLEMTGIPEPQKRLHHYPHMLSGGQRQRVMISMALACRPQLLIADEPTTALDVTVQLQILALLKKLQHELSMSILLISHDLNLVRYIADSVCVMEKGHLREKGTTEQIFSAAQHPYTQKLLNSEPEILVTGQKAVHLAAPLLDGKEISCQFMVAFGFLKKKMMTALDKMNIHIYPGETVGIVGESGSGKSTLGRCLLGLEDYAGEVILTGDNLKQLASSVLRKKRKDFQVVFQDPYASLSPRMQVGDILEEGLFIHFPQLSYAERHQRIVSILDEVGLDAHILSRYPHEFSGGQRQRIAIARVVVLEPKLILLDEPTSALDATVQKQVLEVLWHLQQTHQMSYIFISHDLKVIRAIAHRVMVMKQGTLVEQGTAAEVFDHPQSAYTQELLRAALFH